MKTRTSKLTGAALDWAVAKCEGVDHCEYDGVDGIGNEFEATRYSTNFAQGGPIMEREKLTLAYLKVDGAMRWESRYFDDTGKFIALEYGPSPLIAAMRCYVAAQLGNEIDVPEELE